jgi:NTP pyrophosphatase (non-canonical NTP hydrolase)
MNDPLDSIIYLTSAVRTLVTSKGWREKFGGDTLPPRTGPWFAAYVALAQSELSEALDAYRDKIWSDSKIVPGHTLAAIPAINVPEMYVPETSKPIGVGPELADALIRIIDMADIWNVDLGYELKRVIAYGHTRPYRHGGRIL